MKKDAVINLRIDSELKRKLQDKCYEKRLKMTEAIEQAIVQWLNEDSTQSIQSIQSTQSTQDDECNEDNEDRTADLDIDEINQLKEDNAKLAQRLERLENTLHTIDHEGLSALLTASNTIEHGESLAHQNQSKIASLEHSVDELIENQSNNTNLTQRLERLENKQSENYQAIARLQDTYPEYVEQTKQLMGDVRKLKHETQQLKIKRPSMNDIHNLEVVLAQKIDQQQLDERLAMATMPIWEQIDGNPNSASQDYSSLEVVDKPNNDERDQTSNNQDWESSPTLNDPALEHLRQLKLNQWQSQHTIIKHKTGIRKHLGYSAETKLNKSPSYEGFEEDEKSLFSIFNRNTNQTEVWEVLSKNPYTFKFVRLSEK